MQIRNIKMQMNLNAHRVYISTITMISVYHDSVTGKTWRTTPFSRQEDHRVARTAGPRGPVTDTCLGFFFFWVHLTCLSSAQLYKLCRDNLVFIRFCNAINFQMTNIKRFLVVGCKGSIVQSIIIRFHFSENEWRNVIYGAKQIAQFLSTKSGSLFVLKNISSRQILLVFSMYKLAVIRFQKPWKSYDINIANGQIHENSSKKANKIFCQISSVWKPRNQSILLL